VASVSADVNDPIDAMLSIDDEHERMRAPEADINAAPPADKAEPERDESGKFKGKPADGEKPEGEQKPDGEKPAAKVEAKPDAKKDDHVPLAKYLEERNKLRAELEARDLTIKQINERLAAFEAKHAPAAPPPPAEPDYIEDPKGYVDHKLSATLKAIEDANKKNEPEVKKAQEIAARAAEQVELQRFTQDLQTHEQRFVAQNPDYYDALTHVRNVRAAQLREFDPEITQEQIIQVIRHEETNLAVQLARQGRDPVQTAYNLAHHYGYVKKAAAAAATPPPAPIEKRLPPDQTLGSGAGAAPDLVEQDDGEPDPVDLALASLTRRRA
jgi:hypothetical protein